jgi:hypothetical protein
MTLAWVPVGLEPVAAAQRGKQAPAPAVRQRELHFDSAFGLLGSLERSKNSTACCGCSVSLALSRSTLEERRYLSKFLAKFVFTRHLIRLCVLARNGGPQPMVQIAGAVIKGRRVERDEGIVISDEKRLAVLSTSARLDSMWLLEQP